ncbi:MAG TPA: hypothetical protein VM689_22950 [Aliidongia sp.]|nr:hypothetical protein [Aliidongia sp.]
MNAHPGDLIIGLMMIFFAILGLILAANALDLEMSVFGLSLAGFAVAFIVGQVRRHFDTAELAAITTERARHG